MLLQNKKMGIIIDFHFFIDILTFNFEKVNIATVIAIVIIPLLKIPVQLEVITYSFGLSGLYLMVNVCV